MNFSFKLKLLRDDTDVGSIPILNENSFLSPPKITRQSRLECTNDVKVQYAQRVGLPGLSIVGIGGTWRTQFIHLSDGRTYANGWSDDGYMFGCCADEGEDWDAARCIDTDNHDGLPVLICDPNSSVDIANGRTVPKLLTSEGDAWNDCCYHLADDGECWITGNGNTYCRGSKPYPGYEDNPDMWWTPRWLDQFPKNEYDNWLQEPVPYGGGEEISATYRPMLMFDENKHIIKITGMGHGGVAVGADGKLWTWGYGGWGIVGRPDWEPDNTNWQCRPYNLMPGYSFIDCAGGYFHSCAIREDGTLWVWGTNQYQQLGLGGGNCWDWNNPGCYVYPTQIGTDTDWVRCWAPHQNTAAQKSDGTIWYTGSYCYGEMGDGRGANGVQSLPNCSGQYQNLGMALGGGGKVFELISVGSGSSVGITADGKVWAWGGDIDTGVLGQGDLGRYYFQNTPREITGVPVFTKIWTSGYSTLSVTEDNEVYYWGELYGQTYIPTKIGFDFITGEFL